MVTGAPFCRRAASTASAARTCPAPDGRGKDQDSHFALMIAHPHTIGCDGATQPISAPDVAGCAREDGFSGARLHRGRRVGVRSPGGRSSGGRNTGLRPEVLLAFRHSDTLAPLGPPPVQEAARDITALGGTAVLTLVTLIAAGFLALDGKKHMALFVAVPCWAVWRRAPF